MALVRWELDRFFDDMPLLPTRMGLGGGDLAVDVYEDGGDVVAKMNVAGIEPEKLEVSFEDGYLRVSGSREAEKEETKRHFYSKEIRRGSFERVVHIPEKVDGAKVKANYAKGVLEVRLPKLKSPKPEKVKIEVKD